MKMKVTFTNGMEPIEVSVPEEGKKTPYELVMIEGSNQNREKSFLGYVKDMDLCFIGVSNGSDPDIESIEIDDIPNMQKVRKANGKDVLIGDGSERDEKRKYDTVIYDLASATLIEKMYYTRNGRRTVDERVERQKERERFQNGAMTDSVCTDDMQGNIINRDILVADSKNPHVNIPAVIALTTKYIKGYSLSWNDEYGKLELKTADGQRVVYDKIAEDGVYAYIKLISLIMNKGRHTGVFYINTTPLTLDVLEAMLKLIELVYGEDATVFLYGLQMKKKNSKIERKIVSLPNYVLEGKRKG